MLREIAVPATTHNIRLIIRDLGMPSGRWGETAGIPTHFADGTAEALVSPGLSGPDAGRFLIHPPPGSVF